MPKPITQPADIDWQMRYGETETEQIAQFLGYGLDQPEENDNERSSHSS